MGELISNYYDLQLLNNGISSFTVSEKNSFIMHIAQTKQIPITNVNGDYLLEYHKEIKIKDFSNKCEEFILKGFVSSLNGHHYRTNRDDQFNMFVKYSMTKDNPNITEIMFKVENLGEQIPHTKEEFATVVMEGYEHVESSLAKLDNLRKLINNCLTDDEIISIIW